MTLCNVVLCQMFFAQLLSHIHARTHVSFSELRRPICARSSRQSPSRDDYVALDRCGAPSARTSEAKRGVRLAALFAAMGDPCPHVWLSLLQQTPDHGRP